MTRKVLALLIAFSLSGCGFQLMKSNRTPVSLCLTGKNSTTLANRINNAVCKKDSPTIKITGSRYRLDELTVSANNNIRQYQLSYHLQFDLLLNNNKPTQSYSLRIDKPLYINNNAILSSNYETKILKKELKQAMARRLLLFLRFHKVI